MKRLFTAAIAATALTASPTLAEDTFNEDAVAAMKGNIVIEAPWAVSLKDDEIVVFMLIHNSGEEGDTITSVSSKAAKSATLAKFEKGPLSDGTAVEKLDTPGGSATALDQDGYHLQLSDLTEDLKSGDIIPVTLEFAEAGEMDVQVSVAIPQ